MKKLFGVTTSAVLAVTVLAACGDDDNGGSDTTAAPATTASPNTTSSPNTTAAAELDITKFEVSDPTSCDGDQALAPAEWETTGAEGVSFSVDGEAVPADAGNPTSGSGNVPIPCDGESHEVTITAGGAGGASKSDSKTVTAPSS
ncbi:MAG: hypothetical protein AAFY28_08145 [Actinomycetota bacterium]